MLYRGKNENLLGDQVITLLVLEELVHLDDVGVILGAQTWLIS